MRPNTENGTVAIATRWSATKRPTLRIVGEPAARPRRQRNVERRPREYLTPAEVETLIVTANKRGRYGHRDATMILIAYRHGLRVGELCALTWDQVDFGQGLLHVTRLKHGVPLVHPLGGEELRALRRLQRKQAEGRHLFQTERNAPITPAGFRKTLARIGEASALGFPVHPHMRRHACGYKLANDGQDTRTLTQPRAPEHSAHGEVHRTRGRPVQWLLAGLRRGGASPGRARRAPEAGGPLGRPKPSERSSRLWRKATRPR